MFYENELIEVKLGSKNIKWFEERGYECGKIGEIILVKAKDLKPHSRQYITAKCDYCGNDYKVIYESYNQSLKKGGLNKCACEKCAGRKNSEVRLQNEKHRVFDKLIKIMHQLHYTLITSDDQYSGEKMKVKYICPIHGEQEATIDNLLHGHKCFYCSYNDRFDDMRNDPLEVKKKIEEVNNNLLLNPSEYKNAVQPNLIIKCGCCGKNTFTTSYSNYITHDINRCRYCSNTESAGERAVRLYLESLQINYVQQKKFEGCVDKRQLPFDFYLIDQNILIEYDGEQHYWAVFGEKSFQNTLKHDEIKNNYCKENDIPLLRIPYWEKDNIKVIIDNFINNRQKI